MIHILGEAPNHRSTSARSLRIAALSASTLMLSPIAPAEAAPTDLAPLTEFVLDLQLVQLPEIVLDVDPKLNFDHQTGTATISGTVYCPTPLFVNVYGDLKQRVLGSLSVNGLFSTGFFFCEGETPWIATVFPSNGSFKGGHAVATVFATCDGNTCDFDFVDSLSVHLSGGGGK